MLQCGAMRCRIDATREPRGDDEALQPELACELAGEFLSDGGTVAGADDSDDGDVGEFEPAFEVEQRRGRIDFGERPRIARFAESDEACSQAFGTLKLGLCVGLGVKADVMGSAASPGQHRQRGDGGLGAAKLIDERTEGGRPHIFASDQPEPGDALRAAEPWRAPAPSRPYCFVSPMRASSPRARRPILAAWRR